MDFAIRLFFILCLGTTQFSIPASAQKKHNVYLSGTLANFDNEVELEDMSEMKYINPSNPDWVFKPDESGHFAISFYLEQPRYFRLGRNILYLMPGDRFDMFVDEDFPDTAIYRGPGQERLIYLNRTPFPHAGSFIEAGYRLKFPVQETIDTIMAVAETRRQSLKKIKNEYGDFKKLEAARIDMDILNSLVNMEYYGNWKFSKKPDTLKLYQQDYDRLVKPLIKTYAKKIGANPVYLQLAVYLNLLEVIPGSSKHPVINDWDVATRYASGISYARDKQIIRGYRDSIKTITTGKYRNAVTGIYESALKFSNGDPARDFIMHNTANQEVALSSFKGKVIYVDIWATWCGPCLEEMPYLDSLKEKFRGNNNVAFLSLSIDDENDKQRWLRFLEKKVYSENQFIINRIKLNPYSVATIPRFILIDKKFRLAGMYAERPSSPEAKAAIDALLNSN